MMLLPYELKSGVFPLFSVLTAALVASVMVLNVPHSEATPIQTVTADNNGHGLTREEYMKARQTLMSLDQSRALGAKLTLNEKELELNRILLQEKKGIMEKSRLDRIAYTPALSFFKSKHWMENTTTFKILRRMPKGAALHVHLPAMTSLDYVVKNITYREHVFMCTDNGGFLLLSIFLQPPNDTECQWRLVKTERAAAISREQFDEELRRNLSLLTNDPVEVYKNENKVWERFEKYFHQVTQLLDNAAIMRDYFRQALREFHEDNVQYIEWRGGLSQLTEVDGTIHDEVYTIRLFKNVTDEFVSTHSHFVGAKYIMSGARLRPEKTIEDQVKKAMSMRRKFPDFFLGYDLVAQEDRYNPLLFYLDALLYPTSQSLSDALPYFFHAGETKWEGTEVDENLFDAFLLNTSRIGHGYALAKHPELADMVKSRGIAVEVNPISNQLLGLVSDLRNHPMAPLLADDFPLVISSDDPATWEALPLTHDFFVAFMDLSSQDMGLGFLKQLAINSIKYSALSNSEKQTAMTVWQSKWDEFVTEAITEFS